MSILNRLSELRAQNKKDIEGGYFTTDISPELVTQLLDALDEAVEMAEFYTESHSSAIDRDFYDHDSNMDIDRYTGGKRAREFLAKWGGE